MKKKTFIRYVVIKNCKQDFGMGPEVIGQDEVTFTDERGQGFKTPLFAVSMLESCDELIKRMVTVTVKEKRPKNNIRNLKLTTRPKQSTLST